MHLFVSSLVETTLWQRRPPCTLSYTLPGYKRILEKYVFCAQRWTFEIALLPIFTMGIEFLNGYNSLNIALGPHELT